MNKIHVIGIGFRPLEMKASRALLDSDVVLSNGRLLDVFKGYSEYEDVKGRIIEHNTVYEMLDYIAENHEKKKISLLAAGDPMFFGIGRLVIERLGREAAEIYPDLSSIQVAFSRARVTENNAFLVSLHGGPDPEKRRRLEYELSEVPGLLARYGKLAVLTDRENNPSKIAEELTKPSAVSGQLAAVKMYVCEKLGYEDEKITEGSPSDIAKRPFEHPNVVIVTSEKVNKRESGKASSTFEHSNTQTVKPVFGLREDEIPHARGLITKDEVRAVAIHKLRLPRNGVMWDVGAGSGSVSIECAKISPGLDIYAVEKKDEQTEIIKENVEKFGITNVTLIESEAPGALDGLPRPDRVFIGGSGGEIGRIVEEIRNNMRSGIVVVNAVTIETLNDAVHALEKNGFTVNISEVSVSRSKQIGTKRQMNALNPIFVISGELK